MKNMIDVTTLRMNYTKGHTMLNYIITFFVLAVFAALLGFGGLAGAFAQIAQFLALIFVLLFVASLIYHVMTGRKIAPPL
jgi:uncharacterized membrane protein YtjA (UPF0391 family)